MWCRLGCPFLTRTGSTPPTKDTSLYGPDYPFFKPADLNNGLSIINSIDHVSEKGFRTGRMIPSESVLVTCIGATIGKTGIIRRDGICNQQINAILPNKYMCFEFIYFQMCSSFVQAQIKMNASATTLPLLNKTQFDKLLIILPPANEQNRIAKTIIDLLRINGIIESKKQRLYNLLENTKSKILDLAIRGKLVTQNLNDEPASVLLERIQAEKEALIKQGKIKRDKNDSVIFKGDDNSYYELFRDGTQKCIDNEIHFDIPDNWRWCRLKNLAAPESNSFADGPFGSNLKREHYTDTPEVRIIQLNNIGNLEWKDEIKKYTTYSHAQTLERCKTIPGDIVIAKMMPAGRAIIVPNVHKIFVISSDNIRLRLSKNLETKYVYYMINSPSVNRLVLDTVQGVGRTRTSLGKLREIICPIPPIAEQERIVTAIEKYIYNLDIVAKT